MKKGKQTESDAVKLLHKALRQFKNLDKEDVYGYSNVGLKVEKSAKKVQQEIATFLS